MFGLSEVMNSGLLISRTSTPHFRALRLLKINQLNPKKIALSMTFLPILFIEYTREICRMLKQQVSGRNCGTLLEKIRIGTNSGSQKNY